MIDKDKLRTALKEAHTSALAANVGDDGGSCNLDVATIKIPGIREATMKKIAQECGFRANKMAGWFWGGRFSLAPNFSTGCASRNERVVTAICAALKRHGFDEFPYRQMD